MSIHATSPPHGVDTGVDLYYASGTQTGSYCIQYPYWLILTVPGRNTPGRSCHYRHLYAI